jgi:hypothetical protein
MFSCWGEPRSRPTFVFIRCWLIPPYEWGVAGVKIKKWPAIVKFLDGQRYLKGSGCQVPFMHLLNSISIRIGQYLSYWEKDGNKVQVDVI